MVQTRARTAATAAATAVGGPNDNQHINKLEDDQDIDALGYEQSEDSEFNQDEESEDEDSDCHEDQDSEFNEDEEYPELQAPLEATFVERAFAAYCSRIGNRKPSIHEQLPTTQVLWETVLDIKLSFSPCLSDMIQAHYPPTLDELKIPTGIFVCRRTRLDGVSPDS